ncbi:MAG TPA: 7TM diverse intracellular signaling domain-containing protein [Spirochaetota bacterium]|nr:7TM diverse intracellular signaling domain-containing protein [Spirochaetota bacterium]
MKLPGFLTKLFIASILLFITLLPVYSQSPVLTLQQNQNSYKLGTSLEILEDKDGIVVIQDFLKKDFTDSFIRSKDEEPKMGYSTSTFWVRFRVDNPEVISKEMYLEIAYQHLDDIELYAPDSKNKYHLHKAGFKYNFENRQIQHRNFIFKININHGINTYYVKIKSSSLIKFPMTLQTPEYFAEAIVLEYLLLGLYYGILIVMVLYNLFVFFSVRDISYLYYILYIVSFIFFTLALTGVGFQYIWPHSLWWAKISTPFFIFMGIFLIGQFIRTFLDLKKLAPVAEVMVVLMMIWSFAGMIITLKMDYSFATRLSAITTVTAVFNYFIVGIISAFKGNRTAKFYLLAWTLYLTGCSLLGLQYAGYLPSNFITQYSVQIGSAAEVILLSFALGDRINILQEEKETAQLRTIEIQKSATENLERKVAERTLELNKANEHLKELDKIKSNFFANISHEIRTPLTLILSPIESVLQGDYDGKIDNRFFENLQRNAIKLLKLINNLLDFSKIEAGRMNLKIQVIDIVSFIRNYTSSIHSAAESKGISITFDNCAGTVPLYIDMEKMDKIVMNLFSNSLKFTDRGGFIKVTVRDDDFNCYIDFEDSGIGIPSDKLESIFDRFSQVDAGSTRKYEGTGIGLALAKELVEMHGGAVSVTSRFIDDSPANHGTVFTVKIPKGKEHLSGNENFQFIESVELEESVSDYRFFGMREMSDLKQEKNTEQQEAVHGQNSNADILIVEDNPDMQHFLKFLLQKYYRVHIAENGEVGLKTAHHLRPALIISDVMMPVMNGYEMTRRIKEDKLLQRTPVIMLTAKSDISSKIEGIEYGADDYLTKPFNSKELLTRIKMLLKTRNYEITIEKRNNEIEEELRIARLIQRKLLPHNVPDISGFRFHSTYIPMDKVGGDFYDFKENGNQIEIFIADVSGHGLVSAFISMIAKMAFDSIYEKKSCTEVLHQLNAILCNSTVNSIYMTTFFCLIERESKKLRYANAGHFYPVVFRKNTGEFFELKAQGKPLGWFNDLKLAEEEVQLNEGDRVVFYTDGITECMNLKNELFGENRFREFIKNNAEMEPVLFSGKLIDELKTFCSSDKFNDDLCLLVFDVCH